MFSNGEANREDFPDSVCHGDGLGDMAGINDFTLIRGVYVLT